MIRPYLRPPTFLARDSSVGSGFKRAGESLPADCAQPSAFQTGSNVFFRPLAAEQHRFCQGFSTGASFQVNFTSNRQSENSTRLNESVYDGDLNVSFIQPLLLIRQV
jgi:hypothetical protein